MEPTCRGVLEGEAICNFDVIFVVAICISVTSESTGRHTYIALLALSFYTLIATPLHSSLSKIGPVKPLDRLVNLTTDILDGAYSQSLLRRNCAFFNDP